MAFDNYSQLSALIVDDFKNFRDSLKLMLERFGMTHVDVVGSGNHALKRSQHRPYDLVFCDYNLGDGKNGVQVMETLRHQGYLQESALLIVITGESDRAVVMATYDCAPDAYLCKPITTNFLKVRLDRLLESRAALKGVREAMTSENFDEASEMCELIAGEGGRRQLSCQKLLGEIYLKQQALHKAAQLYEGILSERAVTWAQVGLAQVKSLTGEQQGACKLLNEVLEDNPHHLEAYDLLASIYYEEGDTDATQAIVEDAVKICPLSVPRRRKLADAARDNLDLINALNAYRQCIDMGAYSCFDNPDSHINFGRAAAALLEVDEKSAKKWSNEAMFVLENVPKRFRTNFDEDLQLMLIQSALSKALGHEQKSQSLFAEASRLREGHLGKFELETELDMVATLNAHGQLESADEILKGLLVLYADDDIALMKMDRFLDEPRSAVNRRKVARINAEGVGLYNEQRYGESIEYFLKAKHMFPRHVGIMLNLVQALNAEMELGVPSEAQVELALATLKCAGRSLTEADDVYSRYVHLEEQLASLVQQA